MEAKCLKDERGRDMGLGNENPESLNNFKLLLPKSEHKIAPNQKSRLPKWHSGKDLTCQWRRHKRCGFNPSVRMMPWSRKWQPAPVCLTGKFNEQRSLVGYGPWDQEKSDATKPPHTQNYIK